MGKIPDAIHAKLAPIHDEIYDLLEFCKSCWRSPKIIIIQDRLQVLNDKLEKIMEAD